MPPERGLLVGEQDTERLLRAHLRDLGVHVEQDDAAVAVHLLAAALDGIPTTRTC
jgi:hypothetical protein